MMPVSSTEIFATLPGFPKISMEVVALADPVERCELLWQQQTGDGLLGAGAHG
jgi:hypothetical protein